MTLGQVGLLIAAESRYLAPPASARPAATGAPADLALFGAMKAS